MRLARAVGDQLVVRGNARRTTYAARRQLRGSTAALPAERELWDCSARAAMAFWELAAADQRISAEFRRSCADNVRILQRLMVG